MSGATKAYRFGQKNQWRRTVWNAIAERLTVPPREAVVLYLAGAEDLDRAEALRRGFRSQNLIAIERDGRVANALRDRSRLVLCGDILDAVTAWPPHRDIHVVHGDFCSDMTAGLARRWAIALTLPQTWNTVISVNWLRGRDATATAIRRFHQQIVSVSTESGAAHRGDVFRNEMLWRVAVDPLRDLLMSKTDSEIAGYVDCIEAWTHSVRFTYRSDVGQMFDSVVMRNPCGKSRMHTPGLRAHGESFARQRHRGPMRRRIAAVLAHRTMRIQGRNAGVKR